MSALKFVLHKSRETLEIYWILVRITVPITIVTEVLSRLGVIKAIAPAFSPFMSIVGLPPELGLAWLSGMLIGIWGAIPLVFTLIPLSSLTTADITVFSALLLFAHGLPIEQKIIQQAGPGMVLTILLRVIGGFFYAFLLHNLLATTGWLAGPANPSWIPISASTDWSVFFVGLLETMIVMLVVLTALSWALEFLKYTGILALMMRVLAPVLRLAGIQAEAGHLTAVGLFLGISYGGGLLIREARSGAISPRQIFLSCIFMGFAHSIIEDTLIVMAIGADISGVLIGRLIFAMIATAIIAGIIRRISEETFFAWGFRTTIPARSPSPSPDT